MVDHYNVSAIRLSCAFVSSPRGTVVKNRLLRFINYKRKNTKEEQLKRVCAACVESIRCVNNARRSPARNERETFPFSVVFFIIGRSFLRHEQRRRSFHPITRVAGAPAALAPWPQRQPCPRSGHLRRRWQAACPAAWRAYRASPAPASA